MHAWIGHCFLSCALYQIANLMDSDENCESKQELEMSPVGIERSVKEQYRARHESGSRRGGLA